jgi:tetratricopeptide (TPR) repeat protein
LSLVAAVMVVNALWRGGVGWRSQVATVVAAAAALWLATGRHGRPAEAPGSAGRPVPWLVAGLGALTLLVLLQLVPLPTALLEVVAPGNADVQRDTLAPLGLWPGWRPLSLDPGATGLELAKLASWTALAAAAALLSRTRERREQVLAAVALAGAAVAFACYGAVVAGLERLTESRAVFINPNHLASFMLLGCFIALGLGLRARGPRRMAWMAAFVAMVSQVFLSLSRAGIVAFFVGAGVAAVLAIRSGHATRALAQFSSDSPRRAWAALAAPMAVFSALAVSAWLALDRVIGELRSLEEITTDVKLSLWPLAWQALWHHSGLGVGRGAFATVFAAYKVEPAQVTFTHLENTWLQIPLDVGVPVGLALLLLLAWSWLTAARAAELSRPMLGALSGVAAVAVHDLFDFSLELNAIAIPFLVVLAVGAREGASVSVPRWSLRVVAVATVVLGAVGFAIHLPHRADLQVQAIIAAETGEEARAAAVPALAWHPADWIPPAMVGAKLVDEGRCREGIEWLNRAMARNPTAPQPHRSAARCLAAAGQDAAAKREYRLAFAYGDGPALQEALDAFPAAGALLEIAPDTPTGLMYAGSLLLQQGRPDEAQDAYRRAWESFRVRDALAGLARATLEAEEPAAALELARQIQADTPSDPSGYLVAADALVKLDREDDAVKTLEEGVSRLPKRAELLFALGRRHLGARRYSQAKLVFERIAAREGPELALKRVYIARALELQGRLSEALKEARAAVDSFPGDPGSLLTVARIAERSGLYDVAIDAVERVSRLPRSVPGAYDEQLRALKLARTTRQARFLDKLGRPSEPPPQVLEKEYRP